MRKCDFSFAARLGNCRERVEGCALVDFTIYLLTISYPFGWASNLFFALQL